MYISLLAWLRAGIEYCFASTRAIEDAPSPPFSRAPTGGRAINNRQSASLFFPFILFPSFLELTARTHCRRYTLVNKGEVKR